MVMKKDIGRAFLRISAATMMLTHGIPKFMKLIGSEEIEFGNPIGIGTIATFVLAVIAEFVCPILIFLGYKTKWALVFPILTMMVVVFLVHGADPFVVKEKPLMFLVMFISILILGPGKYSLDSKLG